MERKLPKLEGSESTDTVYLNGVSFAGQYQPRRSMFVFVVVSLLLHIGFLSFYKQAQRTEQANKLSSLSVTLEARQINKSPTATRPSQPQTSMSPEPAPADAPALTADDLLRYRERAIEQQLKLESEHSETLRFGSTGRDQRSATPDWLQVTEGEHGRGTFTVEEFPLADGGTFVKLTYPNGKSQCFDVRDADPFDPFSIGVWRFSRCKG